MADVKIGDRRVGDGEPCFVIAEIGINHNGELATAKELVKAAAETGCDAVKFQKRTVEVVYTGEELGRPRESPFGETNGDLKKGLEFGLNEYREIDEYCKSYGIIWFASCWDEGSVDFMRGFQPPCFKIASASLTDDALLRHHRKCGVPIILSTGMSTLEEIDHAVDLLGQDDLVIMHCNSTYPATNEEINLNTIQGLKQRYQVPVGYSGHEIGLATTIAASTLGACAVERHITLNRAMWGSDHAASVEPQGFNRMVRDIRVVEEAMGDGVKKVYESELPVREKLRRV